VVQALIEENYKRLDANARKVIEALAVFRQPVPPLALDYLLAPFAPGIDIPAIIRRLARANVVSVDRATKTITLHPIDQDYAYSQLPEEGAGEPAYTRQALERRAADYYAQLRTPPETWRTIDDLAPQLAEFEHRVQAGDYDDACRVLDAIDFDYLYMWGHHTRLVTMREAIRAGLTDLGLRVATLHSLGNVYRARGPFEEAVKFYRDALDISRMTADLLDESAIILTHLGRTYSAQGEVEETIRCYREALIIARQVGDRRLEGIQLGYLGSMAYDTLGQFDQAIGYYEESLVIAREIGDRRGEGDRLASLGKAYHGLGEIEQAIGYYEEALAIAREIGNRGNEGFAICSLGDAYRALGQPERAITSYKDALAIARETGHRRGEGVDLGSLGLAYSVLGHMGEAIEKYEKALAIACTIGDRQQESIWRDNLGLVYRALGQFGQAVRFHEEALAIIREIGNPSGKSYCLLDLGKTLLTAGKLSEAQSYCAEALELNMPMTSYQAATALGTVLLRQGGPTAAETFAVAIGRCQTMLDKTPGLYEPRYALAAALVGQAVCNPRWADESLRNELLAPALAEYRRALGITCASGVVGDALRDLELIRAAGVEGLESVFKLLESAREKPHA
jgi:tetratricopeptide (TPR) repeat protein